MTAAVQPSASTVACRQVVCAWACRPSDAGHTTGNRVKSAKVSKTSLAHQTHNSGSATAGRMKTTKLALTSAGLAAGLQQRVLGLIMMGVTPPPTTQAAPPATRPTLQQVASKCVAQAATAANTKILRKERHILQVTADISSYFAAKARSAGVALFTQLLCDHLRYSKPTLQCQRLQNLSPYQARSVSPAFLPLEEQ